MYGGAAAGGKSDALLMAAFQHVDIPGYAALLLRRTYTDLILPNSLLDRAHAWLGPTAANWNGDSKTWEFPSGAKVTFGHLDSERDKYRYDGPEFQLIGFDEGTQFTETQYLHVGFGRRRRPASGPAHEIPLRTLMGTNPGGVGHAWVKQRFLIEGPSQGRIFVPARMEDNPFIDREAYEKSLMELDPVTRQQRRWGDWDAREEGKWFDRTMFIPALPAPPIGNRFVRFWDLAATEKTGSNDPDWTAGALMTRTDQDIYVLSDIAATRRNPGGVEEYIRATAEMDGPKVPIYIEQEPGASGKSLIAHFQKRILRGFRVMGVPATGKQQLRVAPFQGQCELGNVKIVEGDWNAAWLDEGEGYPTPKMHDDQIVAAAGAYTVLSGRFRDVTLRDDKDKGKDDDHPRPKSEMAGVLTQEF